MIEVVFSQSAYGSLRVAQSYAMRMRYSDGISSAAEIRASQFCEEDQTREAQSAVVFTGQQQDIYCFSLALSIGDISDGGLGDQRRAVLRQLLSVDPAVNLDYHVDKRLAKTTAALSSLINRYLAGEAVRIWYSHNPDELCGMYWLMSQLRPFNLQTPIYLVKLPLWEYAEENTVISRTGWGEIAPEEWSKYVILQEEVRPARLSSCSAKWQQLQEENSPLRATLNGYLQSVPEDVYDSFILREIDALPGEFKMAVAIGNVLGKYQLGIGDAWIAFRIEKIINGGLLEVVQEAPKGETSYRRILRKRNPSPF